MFYDSNKWLKLQEACMLFLDLFDNWKKLHANIVIMPLFTHVWHDDDEVEPCIAPAQYHDNIDGIENSSKEQDRQNNINRMRDFLKVL